MERVYGAAVRSASPASDYGTPGIEGTILTADMEVHDSSVYHNGTVISSSKNVPFDITLRSGLRESVSKTVLFTTNVTFTMYPHLNIYPGVYESIDKLRWGSSSGYLRDQPVAVDNITPIDLAGPGPASATRSRRSFREFGTYLRAVAPT